MNKLKLIQIVKIIALVFIISVVYTLIAIYPNYGSTYDIGYSTGTVFGETIKFLGTIGIIVYSIKLIKRRAVNRLG